jgi:8-oxo-dGTP pyrophosphatase MutT (NUDIX family)
MKRLPFSILFFYTKDGRVLLQDRKNLPIDDSDWGFFGGIHQQGETPEEALKREIMEELNFETSHHVHVHSFESPRSEHLFEGHIFAAELPENHEELFTVLEGDGMQLHHVDDFDSVKFSLLHKEITTPVVKKYLKKLLFKK